MAAAICSAGASTMRSHFKSTCKLLQVCCQNIFQPATHGQVPMTTPVRTYYADWRMLRDVKRRRAVKDYAVQRLRMNSLRKNNILPKELREVADQEIQAMPRDSSTVRIRGRCAITSRPRGVVPRWRLSRIQFRMLADANQMSGVIRASW